VHFGAGANENGLIILLTIGTGIGSVIVNKKQLLPNMELGHLEFKKQIVEDYVADRVRKKEELSWEKWGKRFNQVLAYYEKIFSPNLFIIGGGVSKKMEKFEKQIKVETTVVSAEMQNNAGIIGAAKNASGL
jgi:polyphosphate glucokinase